VISYSNEKQPVRETQTLSAGCSKAKPIIFAPPQTPFTGAQDRRKVISWRWLLTALTTDPVWWTSMHEISSYRGNRLTNTHINTRTQPQTYRQDRLQYTALLIKLSAQCNEKSAQRDANTARWLYIVGLRRSKKFSPRRRPPSRGRRTANI